MDNGKLCLESDRQRAVEVLAKHRPEWQDDGTDTDDTPIWLGCTGCAWAAGVGVDDDEAEDAHRRHIADVLVIECVIRGRD